MAYIRLRGCKCPPDRKRCSCGAKWSYTVDIGINPVTGKRQQKTKGGFAKKKDAELEAAEIELAIANDTYFEESNLTFAEFAKEWHEDYQLSVKISTANLRLRMIGILNKQFGALRIKDITRKQYQDTLNKLCKSYADNTVGIIHATAKLIFKRAVEYSMIGSDPTEYTRIIRKKKTVEELEAGMIPKYMEKEELALFLKTFKDAFDHQEYTLFFLLAYTGMRIGEAMALKWTDVSFSDQTISITKTCYLPKNKSRDFVLLTPKTKASRREIAIDESLVRELKKHNFRQNNEIQKMNKHAEIYKDHGFVFTSLRNPGYPYNKATIEARMKRALKLSEISNHLSPHSLRHTHTSLLAEAGVNLTEIMDRLGHEDDSVTRRIYLHVTKTKKIEASQKFASLMKNVVKM